MKLYYAKGTCSFGPHVALRELDVDAELVPVDIRAKKLPDGGDYLAVNPKGYVPCLELDDGRRITECGVILQYLADGHPDAGLAPAAGTDARYELQDWLSFIGSEVHKNFPPLFLPYIPDDYRPVARERLAQRLDYMNDRLEGRQWLMGDDFSVADCYACAVLNWHKPAGYDLAAHPNVAAYYDRLTARDSVRAAQAEED